MGTLVKEIMKTDLGLISVSPTAPLKDVVDTMSSVRLSCLVIVVDKKPAGIVTERDIAAFFSEHLNNSVCADTPIEELMTPKPICVEESFSCEDALTLSRSRKLRHLPVINDEDELIGLITQTNLLDAYSKLLEKQAKLESNLEELKLLSFEDPLTGLGNRRAMEVDLIFTHAETVRHDKAYGIALFDIDYFKRYNDHYGHQAGDNALKNVAQSIKKAVRESDRVYRYGGEEFLVLMPESDLDAAMICGERIRQAVFNMGLEHVETPLGKLTISGGIVSSKVEPWKDLIELADKSLYQSKSQGRNRVSSVMQEDNKNSLRQST